MRAQEREPVEQQRRRDRIEFKRHRQQQPLTRHRAGPELFAQPFVPHAFVRRAAVQQHNARRSLEQGEQAVGHAQERPRGRSGRRRRQRGRQRWRNHGGRGHRGPIRRDRRTSRGQKWRRPDGRGWRLIRKRAGRNGHRARRRCVQLVSPARPAIPRGRFDHLSQRLQHRPDHEAPHLGLAAEADFALGGMDVHVDRRRVALEKNERQRVASFRQRLAVALDQRVVERPAVDRPRVHEHDHFMPRRPTHAGPADQPRQPQTRLVASDRNERLCDLPAEDLRHPLVERAALR